MFSRLLADDILAFFPVDGGKKMIVAFELLLNAGIFIADVDMRIYIQTVNCDVGSFNI